MGRATWSRRPPLTRERKNQHLPPSRPAEGHFRIAEGEWLIGDERKPAAGVTAIVVPAKEVDMVEFLRIKLPDEDVE